MRNYHAATSYACDFVENIVDESGKLDFPETTFAESVFSFSELIKVQYKKASDLLRPDGEYANYVCYDLSPAIGFYLVALAKLEGEFFDYCSDICAANILAGLPLPQPLNEFARDVLKGHVSRPTKRSRPRKKDWLEKTYLLRLTQELVNKYGLNPTRNDEGSNRNSACDAVAEALSLCGRKTSYTELKNLMVHSDYSRLRKEVEVWGKIYFRWQEADSVKNALAPDFYEFWSDAAKRDVLDILGTFPPKRK